MAGDGTAAVFYKDPPINLLWYLALIGHVRGLLELANRQERGSGIMFRWASLTTFFSLTL
jgi:hypothetical protein